MSLTVTHAKVSAIADNPAASAAGEVLPSDWNADHDISVTSLTIATGTITASEPVLDLSQTWNAGAVTFTGIKLNVTNTASAAASKLQDWQVGGVSKASVGIGGHFMGIQANTSGAVAFAVGDAGTGMYSAQLEQIDFAANDARIAIFGQFEQLLAGPVCVGLNFDCWLYRDAADVLAMRDKTTPTAAQTFRVYGTYTNSSNYVRAALSSSSTAVTLAAETAGTGADNVPVNITPAGTEGVQIGNFAQLTEMTAPAAGAANTARIYAEDNGSGKTRLMVIFPSGAAQQIAIEP